MCHFFIFAVSVNGMNGMVWEHCIMNGSVLVCVYIVVLDCP